VGAITQHSSSSCVQLLAGFAIALQLNHSLSVVLELGQVVESAAVAA